MLEKTDDEQIKKEMCKTMKKIAIYMYDTVPIFEISIN